jgi:hypothetical protein
MVRGGGRGVGVHGGGILPLLSKGGKGINNRKYPGHESGHKKPTKGLVITLLDTPKCCSKKTQ